MRTPSCRIVAAITVPQVTVPQVTVPQVITVNAWTPYKRHLVIAVSVKHGTDISAIMRQLSDSAILCVYWMVNIYDAPPNATTARGSKLRVSHIPGVKPMFWLQMLNPQRLQRDFNNRVRHLAHERCQGRVSIKDGVAPQVQKC